MGSLMQTNLLRKTVAEFLGTAMLLAKDSYQMIIRLDQNTGEYKFAVV